MKTTANAHPVPLPTTAAEVPGGQAAGFPRREETDRWKDDAMAKVFLTTLVFLWTSVAASAQPSGNYRKWYRT